jgi:Ca2+-binding RTX toxin-like protein
MRVHRAAVALLAGIAVMILASTAYAVVLRGTPGPDFLVGTDRSDDISGLGGDDRIFGLGGKDFLDGGKGDDTIRGDAAKCPPNKPYYYCIPCPPKKGDSNHHGKRSHCQCQTRKHGKKSDKKYCLPGRSNDDDIDGGKGDDRLSGDQGDDDVRGGRGRDLIYGGTGRDHIFGGRGGDVIQARDHERDKIRCGPGFDRVRADRKDKVARDCELVRRH